MQIGLLKRKIMATDISERIKEYRTRLGLSQAQLAESSGLNLRTIQRIESGDTTPRGDSLQRLAATLETSPDQLMNWQAREDKNMLFLLHFSQLAFLAFPLLGIIVPLVIWLTQKDQVQDVNALGKKVLNFQITWNLIFLISTGSFALMRILHFDPEAIVPFEISWTTIFLLTIFGYAYPAILILINAFRTNKGKDSWYQPAIPFMR